MASGLGEPARLMASARTRKPCMLRPLVSSRSRPVVALYISLIRCVALPGLPMDQALRLMAPWAIIPTLLTNEGSENPESSPITILG